MPNFLGSLFNCNNYSTEQRQADASQQMKREEDMRAIMRDFQKLSAKIDKIESKMEIIERQLSGDITRVADLLNIRCETFKNSMDVIASRLNSIKVNSV